MIYFNAEVIIMRRIMFVVLRLFGRRSPYRDQREEIRYEYAPAEAERRLDELDFHEHAAYGDLNVR